MQKLSKMTSAENTFLDINSANSGEILTNIIALRVLANVGGAALVKDYCKVYQCSFI
jgi:hypothetical protein